MRDKKFILKMNADERAALEKLAVKFERSKSDLVRYLIRREAAIQFQAQDRTPTASIPAQQTGASNAIAV